MQAKRKGKRSNKTFSSSISLCIEKTMEEIFCHRIAGLTGPLHCPRMNVTGKAELYATEVEGTAFLSHGTHENRAEQNLSL
jgi:hypothetical protein